VEGAGGEAKGEDGGEGEVEEDEGMEFGGEGEEERKESGSDGLSVCIGIESVDRI